MSLVAAFFCGILFSIGLAVSGMTSPYKVVGFLDFFGNWDPSLLFVMVGAIGVYFVGYRLTVRKAKPVLTSSFHLPVKKNIDKPLIVGSILFGIGWGLAGFCPGPALTSMVTFQLQPITFVIAMILGMIAYGKFRS